MGWSIDSCKGLWVQVFNQAKTKWVLKRVGTINAFRSTESFPSHTVVDDIAFKGQSECYRVLLQEEESGKQYALKRALGAVFQATAPTFQEPPRSVVFDFCGSCSKMMDVVAGQLNLVKSASIKISLTLLVLDANVILRAFVCFVRRRPQQVAQRRFINRGLDNRLQGNWQAPHQGRVRGAQETAYGTSDGQKKQGGQKSPPQSPPQTPHSGPQQPRSPQRRGWQRYPSS